jgi:hypothetical protein
VTPEREKPILALDVDGVISLFGFDMDDGGGAPGTFHMIDGMPHCIPENAADRVQRLAEHYELIWATGWEDRANDHLPRILGLPGELHFLSFDGRARFGTAHWKLDAIDAYAGDRPLAWIDDCLDESCHAWAEARPAPTLLLAAEPASGLTEEHVEELIRWARDGYTGA